jgi:nicotinate phosphoribosyltransferase
MGAAIIWDCSMQDGTSSLLTDLYQLNMIQAYLDHDETRTAVFEFFMRNLPPRRGFLVAAGLEQALEFLEGLRFSPEDIDWLAHSGRFDKSLLEYLCSLRFTGDVHAIPEGTVFFANWTDRSPRHVKSSRFSVFVAPMLMTSAG